MPDDVPTEPSPDARLRGVQLMEAEMRLTREAFAQQGQVLANINNTLLRLNTTMVAFGDFLQANTAQLAKIEEHVATLESRIEALEKSSAA